MADTENVSFAFFARFGATVGDKFVRNAERYGSENCPRLDENQIRQGLLDVTMRNLAAGVVLFHGKKVCQR